jgi:hypothetical protein
VLIVRARDRDVAGEAPEQEFTDLAGAPVQLLALEADVRLSICCGSWLA